MVTSQSNHDGKSWVPNLMFEKPGLHKTMTSVEQQEEGLFNSNMMGRFLTRYKYQGRGVLPYKSDGGVRWTKRYQEIEFILPLRGTKIKHNLSYS